MRSIILGVLGPVEVHSATGRVTWPVARKVEVGLHAGLFDSTTLVQGQARVYHSEIVTAWTPTAPSGTPTPPTSGERSG